MATYWLTFRIHADRTYQERYDDFIGLVNEWGTGFWDEPTSFIAMESAQSIDDIGRALKTALNEHTDIMVIREIGVDSTRYVGEPSDGFEHFFPKAKKL